MKLIFKRIACLLLCLMLFCGTLMHAEASDNKTVTILFTHDMHSHLLPASTEDGGESGGYARLSTLLTQQRKRYAGTPVLTLDAGDFSMGSLFQTIYASDAAELRMLGHLGYDATTFGNHEFDFRPKGLTDMLNNAVASGDPLPYIVEANYSPPSPTDDGKAEALLNALETYGVRDYVMLEREGVRFAIFGLMGKEADEDTPMSGMVYEDSIAAAKRVVAEIQAKESYDYLICLSHSGTSKDSDSSEDERLAREVDGIDVIISGHSHTTLAKPLFVNDTYIVSCGNYAKNLGVLRINSEGLVSYELLPIDETVADDSKIARIVASFQDTVSKHYLENYGMKFDEVLAVSDFDFERTGGAQTDKAMGNLITDAYVYAVREAEAEDYETVTVALNAAGVIRDKLNRGEITVSDAFNVLSLGVGADGTPGYPLVSFYLYGSEIKDGFEVDASVTPLMPAAQLYATGVFWEYNTNRMIFNKVVDCGIINEDGTRSELEDDRLYRVVTGLYCCQMLNTVEKKSHGILSITPRNADGSIVSDYDSIILHDKDGNELKEWYAFASYLQSFTDGHIPEHYRNARGEKHVYASWNPVSLVKNANLFTWLVLILALLVLLAVFFIIRFICKRHRRRKDGSKKV